MVTISGRATALVVMVKVALVCPAGIVTVAGTDASGEFDDSVMTIPPAGAGPFKVAMIAALVPPKIVVEPFVLRPLKFGAATTNP